MRKLLRDNGLTIALSLLFLASVLGQIFTGLGVENEDRQRHGETVMSLLPYLASGHFLSSLFENWESEFLQMATFVLLTAYLFQRGSPESKDPDKAAPQDRNPALDAKKRWAPWPVRAGGFARELYSHSLGLTLTLLFLVSFVLHWINSARQAGEEARDHGEHAPSLLEHLGSTGFWFESFQNWQSEFMSTAVLIVLAIVLRERGSPESKPVSAPNTQTGS
ncbi:MAG: DUF6766 family protein [Caulobacteraceae bacterium]